LWNRLMLGVNDKLSETVFTFKFLLFTMIQTIFYDIFTTAKRTIHKEGS
jgi:hypothetical protein